MDRLEDVPAGSCVLLDEAYLQLHARNSMSKDGRDIGSLVNLSRQRGQTLIFVVQESRQLDINAISQADVIAIKELSEISKEFEPKAIRALIGPELRSPASPETRGRFPGCTVRPKAPVTWYRINWRRSGSLLYPRPLLGGDSGPAVARYRQAAQG